MKKYFLKQNIAFSIIIPLLFLIYSVLLANISTRFANDILVPEALNLLIDEILRPFFEISIWSTLAAFLLIRFYESDVNHGKFIFFAFPIIDILQYIVSILAAWIYDGRPSNADLRQTFFDATLYIVLDNVRFIIIAIICYRLAKSGLQKYKIALKAATSLSDCDIDKAEKFKPLPFKKIFSLDNNVQRAIFFCSLFYSLVLIVSRVIYDIDYGLPTDFADAMWMVLYYFLDIAKGTIHYIISLALVSLLYKAHKKAMLS